MRSPDTVSIFYRRVQRSARRNHHLLAEHHARSGSTMDFRVDPIDPDSGIRIRHFLYLHSIKSYSVLEEFREFSEKDGCLRYVESPTRVVRSGSGSFAKIQIVVWPITAETIFGPLIVAAVIR